MATYFIILVLLIVCNATIDRYRIEVLKQSFTEKMYRIKTFIRSAIMIANSIISLLLSHNPLNVWNIAALTVLQSAVFWLFFDILLSLLRGKEWDYIGKTASSDTRFHGDFRWQFGVKLLYLLFGIAVCILRFVP